MLNNENTKCTTKSQPKAARTRLGMLQDWRQGSTSGKAPRRKPNALRDGR